MDSAIELINLLLDSSDTGATILIFTSKSLEFDEIVVLEFLVGGNNLFNLLNVSLGLSCSYLQVSQNHLHQV